MRRGAVRLFLVLPKMSCGIWLPQRHRLRSLLKLLQLFFKRSYVVTLYFSLMSSSISSIKSSGTCLDDFGVGGVGGAEGRRKEVLRHS